MKKILPIFFVLLIFGNAEAAELYIQPKEISSNQPVSFEIWLNPNPNPINAIEGEIVFPPSLKILDINDANSIVSLWLDKPVLHENKISFSGIIPGGLSETAAPILKVKAIASEPGLQSIGAQSLKIYLNDGQGTLGNLNPSLAISVTDSTENIQASSTKDTDPPELFKPLIVKDPSLFDARNALIFDTEDKGAGMDHYEVLEVPNKIWPFKAKLVNWQTATSPYLLKDQNLNSDVYVRAVDREGNFIVVKVPARRTEPRTYVIIIIILLSLILIRYLRKHAKR